MKADKKFIIALDGPSGAGKSTLARAIASRLSIIYVDTGALYRTVGVYALRAKISPNDRDSVVAMLPSVDIRLDFAGGKQTIYLNGEAVGDEIRTPDASMAASDVSKIPEVREFLLQTQRRIADTSSIVMDGRDIGTVIFPNADVKIFLTASDETRAKRRYLELREKGIETSVEEVLADMRRRDENDRTRKIAPAVPASDAVILDNSDLDFEGTIDAAINIIDEKLYGRKKSLPVKRHSDKAPFHYRFWKLLLGGFFKMLFRVRVVGAENLPEHGGVLVCTNHIAIRDVFIVAASLDRQPRFMAKEELFKIPVLASVIRSFGAFPIDRRGKDVDALKKAIALASGGEVVTVFPQGARQPGLNPADTPVKNGVGLIAYHASVPMVPVCIRTKNVKYRLFRPVELLVGKPISPEEAGFQKGGTAEYRAASEKVFAEICRLGGYEKTAALPAPEKNG